MSSVSATPSAFPTIRSILLKSTWTRSFLISSKNSNSATRLIPTSSATVKSNLKCSSKKQWSSELDHLATGHYAQTQDGQLLRSVDQEKDQTYFLYTLKKEILEKVLFPIGHLKKDHVRQIAKEHGLSTAEKKDSTGICFIGERKFRDFISEYIPYQEGRFETLAGQAVGTHQGAAFFTIGQRKGLKIGGPGEAWFVVDKDIKRNVVYVEQGDDHPALYDTVLTATDVSWVSGVAPEAPFRCTSKIRYRQIDQECLIEKLEEDKVFVSFPLPQRAITPRQATSSTMVKSALAAL